MSVRYLPVRNACVAVTAVLVACAASACSSSHKTGAGASTALSSTSRAAPSTSAASSTSVAASSSAPAAGSLSGKWAGSYSGSYTGTFTLNWTQSGSQLTGTIDLSTSGMTPLNGTVNNGHITFGTVGSTVITYSGTVSGNSMSGSWQIAGGAGGSGSWNGHRS